MKIRKNSVSGVALIIVLGFLVIISALTVAFFSSVNTELKASRNFAAGITTRQLADSSVQIVMGQIANATTRGIDGDGVGHEAWASQPGMIRVFGQNTGSAYSESDQPDAFFKLYSSDKMMLTGTDVTNYSPGNDVLASWDQSPAFWTDLNAPVIIRDGTVTSPRFPIIDPRAYAKAFDPKTPDWTDNVEGFYYDTAAGISGLVGPGAPDSQRLPMPVRWIYVLQDGTLTVPDATGSGVTATFALAPASKRPSATNPIVGRIAFWTDDETSKLNLNTAAGHTENLKWLNSAYQQSPSMYPGSYWDTPRFCTYFDYGTLQVDAQGYPTGDPDTTKASGGLALCQLVQNEFQRYPGHPATTSLAPVLNSLLNSEQIYEIAPRYSNQDMTNTSGGTQGGTRRIKVDPYSAYGQAPPTGAPNPAASDNLQLQPKQDRLYATLDELVFAAHTRGVPSYKDTYARTSINTGTLPTPLSNNPLLPISPQLVDKLRFFVSTQGRSPELNLSGQPRVSAWPVRAEGSGETTSGLNVYDNLILFCSTVGGANNTGARPDTTSTTDTTGNGIFRYIFTRREPAASDLTTNTYTDVQNSQRKRVEFRSSYRPDWKFTRNQQLLSTYLWKFMNKPIPGNGKTFVGDKYSSAGDAQGVLTEIFDYIRLANSQDTTTSLIAGSRAVKFAPQGYVFPSKPSYAGWTGKGFGRMSTICEATLVFYYAGPLMDPDAGGPAANAKAQLARDFVPVDATSNGYLANTGWSKWDPLHPNSRYVKVNGYDPANPSQKLPNYGQIEGGYMRAFMLFSTFDPMQGYAPKADPGDNDPKLTIEAKWNADFSVDVDGLGLYKGLGFPVGGGNTSIPNTTIYRAPGSTWGGRNTGGYEGFQHTLHGAGTVLRPFKTMLSPNVALSNVDYGESWIPQPASTTVGGEYIKPLFTTAATNVQEYYPFQGTPVAVKNDRKSFAFHGGDIEVKLYYGGSANNGISPALQTINFHFDDSKVGANWPVPQGAPQIALNKISKTGVAQSSPTPDPATWLAMPAPSVTATSDNTGFGLVPQKPSPFSPGGQGMRAWYWTGNGCFFANTAAGVRTGSLTAQRGGPKFETSLQASWAFATRLAWVDYRDGDSWDPHSNSSNGAVDPGWWGDRWRCIVQPGDTIRSLVYWDGQSAGGGALVNVGKTSSGDLRIAALTDKVPASQFAPHPDYFQPYSRACVLRAGDGSPYFPVGNLTPLVGANSGNDKTGGAPAVVYSTGTDYYNPGSDVTKEAQLGNHVYLGGGGLKMQFSRAFANLPWGGSANPSGRVDGVTRPDSSGKYAGDFDTGIGNFADGPFCNKQDEGNVVLRYWDGNQQRYVYPIPYFTSTWSYQPPGNTFTSPSRQMPSPAMFGSLPSWPQNGGAGGSAWTTLSFSPNTAGEGHPGNSKDPKDHYLLDLFMNPIVEPYPISEPFSTAGKVNLNYRIAPFDYIRRSTALRGALYPLRITAVNSQWSSGGASANYLVYKTGTAATKAYSEGTPITQNFRLRIDRDETIKAFDGFFDEGLTNTSKGFFKSATQICERYFYSQEGTQSMSYKGNPADEANFMRDWWKKNGDLTGDNEREKPYVDLYPRITTKSNTYTVHMKVQTLRQSPGHPTQWIEGKDVVLAEYRGSSTIERYIDPADPRFNPGNAPFYNPDMKSLEPLYRFRTVYTRKFTP